jgi:hypothetical protein
MKILHALVGYLAVTVTSLPPHPFAFASPLSAIHYDGYMNTTQYHIDGALMKHVLGSIVETCQTVTYHSDSALTKRLPGDIKEARQEPPIPVIPVQFLIAAIIVTVIIGVIWIGEDDPVSGNNDVEFLIRELSFKVFCQRREAFTQDTISKVFSKYPKLNWVVCDSPYSVAFDGVEGTDWGHTHHKLPISFYRTIGSVLLNLSSIFWFSFSFLIAF